MFTSQKIYCRIFCHQIQKVIFLVGLLLELEIPCARCDIAHLFCFSFLHFVLYKGALTRLMERTIQREEKLLSGE